MNLTPSDAKDQTLSQVKELIVALTGAFKKRNLYSETHSVYQNALNSSKKRLDAFLDTHGELRFDIDRNRLRFGDEIIHDGKWESTDLFYVLFRDGILWINFQAGLELWELDTFLGILQKHLVLEDDAEDDVTTALWEFNLHAITYEAADLELSAEDVIDHPEARCCADPQEQDAQDDHRSQSMMGEAAAADQPALHQQAELWHISAREQEMLRKMVAEEERLDGTDYVIDVLLYILEQQAEPGEDIENLLKSLAQELHEAAVSGRFNYFYSVMRKLTQHLKKQEAAKHWSIPYLERFFASLAGSDFLKLLTKVSSHVENCDPEQRKAFRSALLLLDASAILAIGPLLMDIKTTKMYQLLLETIGIMAGRQFVYLEKLLASSPPELVRRLIFILRHMKDQQAQLALKRLLGHNAPAVRMEALKTLLAQDGHASRHLFELIDDPDASVRQLLLEHLGRKRDLQTEKLLLGYLQTHRFGVKEAEELRMVSKALGRCGSDRCIDYLIKEMYQWPVLGVLRTGRSHRRQAAVIALQGLQTPKAAKLIEHEQRGFFGNLFRQP